MRRPKRSRPSARPSTTSRGIRISDASGQWPVVSGQQAGRLSATGNSLMSRRRVVVTGLGVVTSLGEQADEVWENVCAGRSGIAPITRWDTSKYPVRIGGECTHFDVTKYGVDGREAKRLDRFGQFGIAASVSAAKDAG